MNFIETHILEEQQKSEVVELWNREYPINLQQNGVGDFDDYIGNLKHPMHVLLTTDREIVKGWYCDFVRDDEKWFSMILSGDAQGLGYGTRILKLAKSKETELNGWVIDHDNDKKQNGEPYRSPMKFYLRNGFKIISDIRLELKHISAVKIRWTR